MLKRTRAEWAELVEEHGKSGKSQREWCELNGVNYHTFVDWSQRLRKASGTSGKKAVARKSGWVELEPKRAANHEPFGRLQVEIGAFRVIVPEAFEEAPFKRVCKALSELC